MAIPSNDPKLAQTVGKSRVRGAIGFGFASHWLKNWRESFKPIIKRSNCNPVITFDSHLKTALTVAKLLFWFLLSKFVCDDRSFCANSLSLIWHAHVINTTC